ncbi:DUF488 domain-containing protein [Pseudorhizobium flavum]|uniref:DUF488 domain-containing protein n=1 Tax=Pseudorhizobium flavum TaxID=1335061 RepID=UPI0037704157
MVSLPPGIQDKVRQASMAPEVSGAYSSGGSTVSRARPSAEPTERQVPVSCSLPETIPFFTIGHSTRSIPDFVDLLRAGEVQMVVDVRSIRRSRANPQFNEETLAEALSPYQVGYLSIPELGGRRRKERSVDQDLNSFWNNRSFHNYADYALTDPFKRGLAQLISVGASRHCAIMCAESVWWRCHRRIIGDYLLQQGAEVYHLMEGAKVIPATLTKGAVLVDEQRIIYPAAMDGECCRGEHA